MHCPIDVVFVYPKSRCFVVLHNGQFWQLPRMHLSKSTWILKLLYEDSLTHIFVAKQQSINDEQLAQILYTHDLPSELAGVTARRFLDWWTLNRRHYSQTLAPRKVTITATPNPAMDIVRNQRLKDKSEVSITHDNTASHDNIAKHSTVNNPPAPQRPNATDAPTKTADTPAAVSDIFDELLQELIESFIEL